MDDELRFEELARLRSLKRQTLPIGDILVGTCPDMCPEYERLERQLHLDLTRPFEMSGDSGKVDHTKAVKKYHRPAAGNEAPLPEDVRPPAVLLKTLDYLLSDKVLMRSDVPFLETQKFLRDRMRSIRQDLTLQNIKSLDSIYLNECIARFHVYCSIAFEVKMPFSGGDVSVNKSDFDPFQNLEQLRKVLTTLNELYEDGHKQMEISKVCFEFENESEFQAYRVLAHLDDPVEVFSGNPHIPLGVKQSPIYQGALKLADAFHSRNIVRFDKIISSLGFFYLFSGFALRWRLTLLNFLTAVCEKGMERREMIYSKKSPVKLDEVPIDLLIKGKSGDYEQNQRIIQLSQDVAKEFLGRCVQDVSKDIGKKCWEVESENYKAQQKIIQEKKQSLVHEVTLNFISSNIGKLLPPVVNESLNFQRLGKFERDKSNLVWDIYNSSVELIIPFYLKTIISDVMAELISDGKIQKKYFDLYRQFTQISKKNRLKIQSRPLPK